MNYVCRKLVFRTVFLGLGTVYMPSSDLNTLIFSLDLENGVVTFVLADLHASSFELALG